MSPSVNEKFGFRVGEVVRMLEETMGDHEGEEFTFPVGTYGVINAIEHYGEKQGWAFTIDIGGKITNVFDEGDGLPDKKFFESTGLMFDRLKQSDFYSHAAFLNGASNGGNDGELDDLRTLFEISFAMLTDEQKFDFFFQFAVQDVLAKSRIIEDGEDDEGDECCDRCNNPLGTDQIGLCDSCQEGDDPHHPDCPATDGFGCRCDGNTMENGNES